MKSAVENLDPTRVKLTVEVPFDELAPSIELALQHMGDQVQIPGFRRGKVPARLLEQRLGRGAVLEHAINDGIPGFYQQAVEQNDLRPMGRPEVEVTRVPETTDADDHLEFTVEVDVRPDIELPDLESIAVTVDSVIVSDDEVTERLDALRERFGTLVGVDRPAADGDFVVLDMRAVIGDEEVDNVSAVSYQIGSGNMLEGLDEALTGLSAGETTTFEAPLAGGPREGETATITVTAQTVRERDLPPADDEFAELASEFDTIEELREDLRAQVARDRADSQAVQARDALIEQILEQIDVPVPQGVVEEEVHRHLENEGRLDDDVHREEVRVEAVRSLRQQIIFDHLAEKFEVSVSQQELIEYLINSAGRMGMDPNELIQALDSGGQIPSIVAEVARSKSLNMALRRVSVTDDAGNPVDLSAFIGSDEADAAAAEAAAGGEATDGDTDSAADATAEETAEDATDEA